MAFFKKKKSCCNLEPQSMAKTEIAKTRDNSVKILGSRCARCNRLEAATKTALEQLGMDTQIDHVTDFVEIAAYGVISTPALVIDGEVVSYGKVLKPEQIVKILRQIRG